MSTGFFFLQVWSVSHRDNQTLNRHLPLSHTLKVTLYSRENREQWTMSAGCRHCSLNNKQPLSKWRLLHQNDSAACQVHSLFTLCTVYLYWEVCEGSCPRRWKVGILFVEWTKLKDFDRTTGELAKNYITGGTDLFSEKRRKLDQWWSCIFSYKHWIQWFPVMWKVVWFIRL